MTPPAIFVYNIGRRRKKLHAAMKIAGSLLTKNKNELTDDDDADTAPWL